MPANSVSDRPAVTRCHRFLRPHESLVGGALECSRSMASRGLRLADEQLGDGSIIEHSGDARTGTIYRFISPRSPWPFGTFFLAVVRLSEESDLPTSTTLLNSPFALRRT